MIVQTEQRVKWEAGEIVAPEDLNAIWLYAGDALDDVASRRFAKGVLPIQCVEGVGTAYTQAMNVEELTFRFISPVTCIIERGFFSANMTCTGDVTVGITDTLGNTPSGCTAPWLSTKGAVNTTTGAIVDATTGIITSASSDVQAFNGDKFVLVAGTEYKIIIAGSANFTLNRFDLALHIATDRWMTAGTVALPSFDPTLFNDLDAADPSLVNANNSALTTAANLLSSSKRAPLPMAFTVHGFVTGTSVNRRKFRIPRFDSSRARAKVIAIYLFAYTAGACTITATLRTAGGATLQTVNAAVVATQMSASLTGISEDLAAGSSGISATSASDYTLEISNSSGAVNCIKATCLVWISRA
jgi:hypothetical protein